MKRFLRRIFPRKQWDAVSVPEIHSFRCHLVPPNYLYIVFDTRTLCKYGAHLASFAIALHCDAARLGATGSAVRSGCAAHLQSNVQPNL